jgi:hypothetical protein
MSSLAARYGAPHHQTDYGEYHVERVRQQIQADDGVLAEARRRRDDVRALAERYPGALRSFPSGSVAHGTVRKPVNDADSGMVLDRRTYPELGPDGGCGGKGARASRFPRVAGKTASSFAMLVPEAEQDWPPRSAPAGPSHDTLLDHAYSGHAGVLAASHQHRQSGRRRPHCSSCAC